MLTPSVRDALFVLNTTLPPMSPAGVPLPASKPAVLYTPLLTGNVTLAEMAAAATYGPMNGPPPGAPSGCTESSDVSRIARPRSTRPLPVWSTLPAGAAVLARREAMTPFEAPNEEARRTAAEPATIAAEADVPLTAP